MKALAAVIARILFLTIAGVLGAVIVGLLVYGSTVFTVGTPGFSFVSFGLSGALIFAFYHVRGAAETITAAVVVSVIQFVISSSWITPMNAGIWSFGVNLPVVLLAFLFERRFERLHQVKFLAVAMTYAGMFVILTLVVSVVSGISTIPAMVFRENFVDGLLIGLGIGIGIEGGEGMLHGHEPAAHAGRVA